MQSYLSQPGTMREDLPICKENNEADDRVRERKRMRNQEKSGPETSMQDYDCKVKNIYPQKCFTSVLLGDRLK